MKVKEICHPIHMLLSCNTMRSAIKQWNFPLIIIGHIIQIWGSIRGANQVAISLGGFTVGLGDVEGVGGADVWGLCGVDGGDKIFDVWGVEGVDGGDTTVDFWSEMEGYMGMVGMKGGLVGIFELDAIAEDPRVADADSKNLGMFVVVMDVWSLKI